MQLHDVMTKKFSVITLDCTLQEAAKKMKDNSTHILPVVKGTKGNETNIPIGVLTDRDITIRAVADGKNPLLVKVRDAFTEHIFFCYEQDTIEEAFETMRHHQIGRILVKNKQDELIGILSMAEIIAHIPEEYWDQSLLSSKRKTA